MLDIRAVQDQLRLFAQDRDWGRFHNPKNLAMALAAEAGELLEQFQWLTPEQADTIAQTDADRYGAVADELADVLIYLLMLAGKLDVDLTLAVQDKISKNAAKYPAPNPLARPESKSQS